MNELPKFLFALREDIKDEKQFLPTRADKHSTGYDVRAAQLDRKDIILRPGQYLKLELGFKCFCPEGWWYKLVPRSSSFAKKSLHALYGVIDETYENNLIFSAQYIPSITSLGSDLTIKFGEAIGQIIPVRRVEMLIEEVSNKEYDDLCSARKGSRKTGGFGSTGR